jgi:hypothetical protein
VVDHARKSSVGEVIIARGSKVESALGVTVIAAPSELMVTRVPAGPVRNSGEKPRYRGTKLPFVETPQVDLDRPAWLHDV